MNDDSAPGWVAFSDNISWEKVKALVSSWFTSSYSYSSAAPPRDAAPGAKIVTPIMGVLKTDKACCQTDIHGSPMLWCWYNAPEELYYVFVIDGQNSKAVGSDNAGNMRVESWDISKLSYGNGKPCILCANGTGDERFKEIYPIFNNSYVWKRWCNVCDTVKILPYPAQAPNPPRTSEKLPPSFTPSSVKHPFSETSPSAQPPSSKSSFSSLHASFEPVASNVPGSQSRFPS
jgi:hypothetical protein